MEKLWRHEKSLDELTIGCTSYATRCTRGVVRQKPKSKQCGRCLANPVHEVDANCGLEIDVGGYRVTFAAANRRPVPGLISWPKALAVLGLISLPPELI